MTPPEPQPNAWCQKLGVDSVDLAKLAARRDINLRDLLMAALLERGAPMTLEKLAARIAAVGGRGSEERLRVSLVKAWKGTPPLYRDEEGRFGFDPHSPECDYVAIHLFPPRRTGPPPPPAVPPASEPLTVEELQVGLLDAYLGSISGPRLYAAVVEAHGRPLTREEVEAFLAPLLPNRQPLSERDVRYWRRPLAHYGDDGRVHLLDAPDQLIKMRQQVRQVLQRTLVDRERDRAIARSRLTWKKEECRREVTAQLQQRALLHGLVVDGGLAALTILDPTTRSLRTLVGDEIAAEAASALAGWDVLVGLDVRQVLAKLECEVDGPRLVDLRSAPKSRRLNRRGRTLKLTPQLLIRSSVGISNALGDSKKMAGYARSGQRTRLAKRLESDAKALYAWYAYGILQRAVRLQWGFLDEMLPVSWAQEGDPYLRGILRAVHDERTVEVVLRTAPGWKDPWARARTVMSWSKWDPVALVSDERGTEYVALDDIVAIRVR